MRFWKNQSGQGMTEYIIIIALVAIAAIAVFSYFGRTVQHQTAAISSSLAGDSQDAKSEIQKAGKEAEGSRDAAAKETNLKNYVDGQSGQ